MDVLFASGACNGLAFLVVFITSFTIIIISGDLPVRLSSSIVSNDGFQLIVGVFKKNTEITVYGTISQFRC